MEKETEKKSPSIWEKMGKIFLTKAGAFALEQAQVIVPMIAESLIEENGEKKREEAVAIIKKEAKIHGVELGTSLINAAIEVAVVELKTMEKEDKPLDLKK